MARPLRSRSPEQISADRAAVLAACDDRRTIRQVARAVGRDETAVYADIKALRRAGHAAPTRTRGEQWGAAVYRHFAEDGTLLYVGCSTNPPQRAQAHALQSPWWRQVVRVEMQWFDRPSDAYAAERVAILTESPRHNNPVRPDRSARQETRSAD